MHASLLTTLCVVALFLSNFLPSSVDAQEQAQLVRVANVEKKVLSASQMNVGTVTPIRTSIIGSAVDGRVLELMVEEGDAIKAEQPVAKLRTTILEIQLDGAKAKLTQLQQRLAELENGATEEEVLQSQARLLAAAASRKFATWDYKRLAELFKKGQVVTENELQKAQSDSEKEDQLYQLASATHKLLIRGPRPEQIAQAKAQVLVQHESIRGIIEQIDRHTLRAPFNGYITVKHSEVGQWLGKGDPVVELIQLDKVDVLTHVVTRNIGQLKIGTAVRIEIDGIDAQLITGTVSAVVPQADIQARTFPVKIRVNNPMNDSGSLLKSGMLAKLSLPIGEDKEMIVVPKDAIVLGGPKPIVFVVDTSNPQAPKAKSIEVALGISSGDFIAVTGALTERLQVVVRGNERLKDGQRLKLQTASPEP